MEKHGYPGEEHNLTTEDGYNIVVHRIPGSPKSPPKFGKPVVFLQHGIAISSDSWVLIGPNSDLGKVHSQVYNILPSQTLDYFFLPQHEFHYANRRIYYVDSDLGNL